MQFIAGLIVGAMLMVLGGAVLISISVARYFRSGRIWK